MTKEFVCIECPRGCLLSVDENLNVSGNSCVRGKNYAVSEMTNPVRMLTSTVKIEGADIDRVPVITSAPIPKGKMFDIMKELSGISVKAPVKMHDVVIKNVLGLGADIIITRSLPAKAQH